MGTVHCFTRHRRVRAGDLPESSSLENGGVPTREGFEREFFPLMPPEAQEGSTVSVICAVVARYIVEVLSVQGRTVCDRARFHCFAVMRGGLHRLLVRVSRVIDNVTGKAGVRYFLSAAEDLYPVQVKNGSETIKNTESEHLLTLPMRTEYRYTRHIPDT